jgi:hypothetical protein
MPRAARIYIIESPSADDFFEGRREGEMLRLALKHAGIDATYRVVLNLDGFVKALVDACDVHRDVGPTQIPNVHLSMHGNKDGIAFSDGSHVTWDHLGGYLAVVNKALGGNVFVVMSTCFGFEGIKMAHREEAPFYALVGPERDVKWSDTVAAFVGFYHHVVHREGTVLSGVETMNLIVREQLFRSERADQAAHRWREREAIKNDVVQRAMSAFDEAYARAGREEADRAANEVLNQHFEEKYPGPGLAAARDAT